MVGRDNGPFFGDRRRSDRWPTDKTLRWRVFRGRRSRPGRLIERSLDGLVLAVAPKDAPPPGTRLLPRDEGDLDRLGFRCAVVRRIERPSREVRLLFAEIEA